MALYPTYQGKVVRFICPLAGITYEHVKYWGPTKSIIRTKSEPLSKSVIPIHNRERSANRMKMDTERHTHIYL